MSLRAVSPPPRATTPEPTLQPLPSPLLRPSRSFMQLKPITTTPLSSHEKFHLTFDEFGTDHSRFRLSVPACLTLTISSAEASKIIPPSHNRPRRKSGPTSPSLQNSMHHKPQRRSGSPPPPAHHHPTPPPPLPPLPPFLVSVARKSPTGYSFDIPALSIFPSTPSTSDESVNSRCFPIRRSN